MEVLGVENIRKNYGGTQALRGVSFGLNEGECLAVVGENGAGKSTLMKILSGVIPFGDYGGELKLHGDTVSHTNPLSARDLGIAMIHQELCLFPELSVAENLFLTESYPYSGNADCRLLGIVHWDELYRRADDVLSELGFQISSRALVKDLSVGSKQLVEIARAFHQNARVIIMDEPTSALSEAEAQQLFRVVERMKGKASFIYISHKLDEVFRLSDRILVLRDGASVSEKVTTETDAQRVVADMVGRAISSEKKATRVSDDKVALRVSDYGHTNPRGESVLGDINFEVHRGEVLGIAGLMGSGRTELLRSLVGVEPGERQGVTEWEGREKRWDDITQAFRSGVAYVPEDRKQEGLFLEESVRFNATLSSLDQCVGGVGFLSDRREGTHLEQLIQKLKIKTASASVAVRTLSGGNQQKVVLARMLALKPRLLLLDEPTRGIDVGAKEEIYSLIEELKQAGMAILLVSSELPEILLLSDRVLVLREGTAVTTLENQSLKQEDIMAHAAGVS